MNNSNTDNDNDIQIDLKELLLIIVNKIWLILSVSLLGFIIAFVYTKTMLPYTYSTSFSLYIKNTTNKTVVDTINSQDLLVAKSIAETYIAILNDDTVIDRIGDDLMNNYTLEDIAEAFAMEEVDGKIKIKTSSLKNSVTFQQVNATELLQVTAYSTDPVMAVNICKSVANIAPEVLLRVMGAGAVEPIGQAKVPRTPIGPNAKRNAAIGFLSGLILACGYVIIRHFFDNTVKNGDIIKNRFRLPLLAEIPYYEVNEDGICERRKKRKGFFSKKGAIVTSMDKRSTTVDSHAPFIVTEAYNTFRTNLIFSLSTTNKNSIIFTSALSGEGKSTSCANLAVSLGETGAKALIIDADLRRPTQHKFFHLDNEVGLSTILGGMSSIEDTINKNVHGSLDVITSGPIPPNPSQMLSSENMKEFVDEISKQYEYVVFDSTPINVVSDALIISQYTAGMVFVVRQDITTIEQVEKAMANVKLINGNILGAVVNSIINDNDKYNYTYEYKYINNKKETASNEKTNTNNKTASVNQVNKPIQKADIKQTKETLEEEPEIEIEEEA